MLLLVAIVTEQLDGQETSILDSPNPQISTYEQRTNYVQTTKRKRRLTQFYSNSLVIQFKVKLQSKESSTLQPFSTLIASISSGSLVIHRDYHLTVRLETTLSKY